MAGDALTASTGLYLDDLNKIRVLEPEIATETETLKVAFVYRSINDGRDSFIHLYLIHLHSSKNCRKIIFFNHPLHGIGRVLRLPEKDAKFQGDRRLLRSPRRHAAVTS